MRVMTDDEVNVFRSDGVVHIRDAVDIGLVSEILTSVEELIHAPGRFGGSMTSPNSTGMYFQDRYLHPTKKNFRRYAHECGLAKSAAKATDSDAIRLYYDHVFV
ncbi:MAG TPA: hypothetical protein DCP89_03810, partial [Acidimicrobiaceae bacterium]|nr:hypothetical protein [Acidimicrobiaceae bacterium]